MDAAGKRDGRGMDVGWMPQGSIGADFGAAARPAAPPGAGPSPNNTGKTVNKTPDE